MSTSISRESIAADLRKFGLKNGDMVLVRGALSAIGRVQGGAEAVVSALTDVVGASGTVVSLAFTATSFLRKPSPEKAFTLESPTYAGALPSAMLAHPGARRSAHPTCSFVAIGRHADALTEGHDAAARAYEPVRAMIAHGAIGLLVGCVAASPGFTTAHLAEADLGLHKRVIFPWLNSIYYRTEAGALKLFRRPDPGLCSMGFSRFYEHYVREGILSTGFVGGAYTIAVPLASAYHVEYGLLSDDPKFAICDDVACATCNGRRWDRLHHAPALIMRRVIRRILTRARDR